MRDCCGILTSKNEKERLCIVQETYPTLSYRSAQATVALLYLKTFFLFRAVFPITLI